MMQISQKIAQTDSVNTRNYGIDLLRIVSMIMIPILHTLGQGKVLENLRPFSASYEIGWFLEIASYCAVNCYALISGFVSYGSKYKRSNIIYRYFQVLFYTIPTTLAFLLIKPEAVAVKTIMDAIFPFLCSTYWYFTAYFCLFFFIPFLNEILDKFDKSTVQKLLFWLFVIFSILPTLFHSDLGSVNDGYSFLWLALLYLLGAYIKKYGVSISYSNWKNLLGYFLCVSITWLLKFCVDILSGVVSAVQEFGRYLISYTAPTIVLSAVFLLLYFSNLKCSKTTKIIRFFAPVSFGVYLLHEEPLIVDNFISGAFVSYGALNPFLMAAAVVGTALCIWLIGSAVDHVRLQLFHWLKIKQLSVSIERQIARLYHWFSQKIAHLLST